MGIEPVAFTITNLGHCATTGLLCKIPPKKMLDYKFLHHLPNMGIQIWKAWFVKYNIPWKNTSRDCQVIKGTSELVYVIYIESEGGDGEWVKGLLN